MTKQPSNGEALLAWQLTQAGIPFRREHRFHPERQWRFDFALGGTFMHDPQYQQDVVWEPEKIAVEVQGGTWIGGRHTSGAGYERDAEKFNEAAIIGWRILFVTPAMVEDGRALQVIERALGRKP